MANYISNKIICSEEILNNYFLDYNPFAEDIPLEKAYITFRKLFEDKSLDNQYNNISYCFGFNFEKQNDDLYEIKFQTRNFYPIKAILKAIELNHDIIWYAVEENDIYVSRFYWNNEVKEDILYIEEEYDKWLGLNIDFVRDLEDYDSGVWYFLDILENPKWRNWKSNNKFKRYLDLPAVNINLDFVRSKK